MCRCVVKEIVSTERIYIDDLNSIVQVVLCVIQGVSVIQSRQK